MNYWIEFLIGDLDNENFIIKLEKKLFWMEKSMLKLWMKIVEKKQFFKGTK